MTIASLAASHHGVVDLHELLDAGISERQVQHRALTGRLHRKYPGVYAVGHPELSVDGRRYAAVRACGPRAVASHLMAAALWGLRRSGRLEVTVPHSRGGLDAVIVHETRRLSAGDTTVIRAIPVTSLARTVVDLAELLPADRLERVLDHAGRHEAFDLGAVEAALARLPGRRGAPKLQTLLGAPSPGPTRSELEDAFLALCRRAGLPVPQLNVHLALGDRLVEVDALFGPAGVIVELDGAATHDTTAAFHADRRRDAIAAAAGFQTLRYTWERVTREPREVTAELRAVLRPRPDLP
ncbi:MAG TPA: type IV toxin-antitoxin system AbiEi family antitoxin domain-containing protein [Baekduia sp.]|uniref:type IV toxin-antitoxin system AbiEi family antitoxin domain-containing protein n=1 Tax=Baekduia sp. TaxID=2600305 RepID=UPI002BBAB72C|nr:type IV toxin-antitoxin system AbiEi family antitoxin domain-containing protein [Baekduia sp.]HMJ32271.1 type IV toxin-antitoxin system AbiEi family antitoxin domain-containing protein [Baekduia sp.]